MNALILIYLILIYIIFFYFKHCFYYNFFMKTLFDFFPFDVFPSIRPAQHDLLTQFEKTTKKYVVIQAPVATGKSAIAVTLLQSYASGYIITPRKFLQDQYAEDFPMFPVLKGKKNSPCVTHNQKESTYRSVQECPYLTKEQKFLAEYITVTLYDSDKVSVLPKTCCPYYVKLREVMDAPRAICNFHSFWFNGPGRWNEEGNIKARLAPRKILIIDEAHELEHVLRNIAAFHVKSYHIPSEMAHLTAPEWIDFLRPEVEKIAQEEFDQMMAGQLQIDENDLFYALSDDSELPDLKKYVHFKVAQLEALLQMEQEGGFVVRHELFKSKQEEKPKSEPLHLLTWVPLQIERHAARLFAEYERVVFMSGTIYDVAHFCAPFGLKTDHVETIGVTSPIPAKIRPIYCHKELMINTGYAHWEENIHQLAHILLRILTLPKLQNVKGLIHTTSYKMSRDIMQVLENTPVGRRLLVHHEYNFMPKLKAFFHSQDQDDVFMSPSCHQGVDFKDDRARFQIIIRVPYPNRADTFCAYQYDHHLDWIHYQTLVTLGQQLGRINRHETDAGITFLLDSRFYYFLKQNKQFLPEYVNETILWK